MSYLFLAVTMLAWGLSVYHAVQAHRTSPDASAFRSHGKNKYTKAGRSHLRRQFIWMVAAILCAAAFLQLRQLEKPAEAPASTAPIPH